MPDSHLINSGSSRHGTGSSRAGRHARIEDVAAAAGVSVATVSRALRGLPNVAATTRAKVVEVARELAYQPDPAATRLAAGHTGTITVAVPMLDRWYFSTVVAGAEAVCADAGLEFQVIGVSSLDARDRLFDDEYRLERRTDGIVLVNIGVTAEQVASLDRRGIALATIGSLIDHHPSVRIDDERVGWMAGTHLIALGHTRIAMIGGFLDDPMSFEVPQARLRGFERALHDHKLPLDESLVASGNFGVTGGYDAMTRLLSSSRPPTAVFAMSDEMAFGALMAFEEHSLEPGVDVSIIGVDDHEFAQVVGLTTIRQPVPMHGAQAAEMLLASMAEPCAARDGRPDEFFAEPHLDLVVRSTTGPVR